MKRQHYRNGEDIASPSGCDDCNPSMINGVLCHETGCSCAWKDYKVECKECGCEFYPEDRWQRPCDGCVQADSCAFALDSVEAEDDR